MRMKWKATIRNNQRTDLQKISSARLAGEPWPVAITRLSAEFPVTSYTYHWFKLFMTLKATDLLRKGPPRGNLHQAVIWVGMHPSQEGSSRIGMPWAIIIETNPTALCRY